jgi:hypothetical protein
MQIVRRIRQARVCEVVTLDAIGTHREIVAQIVRVGGDYLLAVKDNQPALLDMPLFIALFFPPPTGFPPHRPIKEHQRH